MLEKKIKTVISALFHFRARLFRCHSSSRRFEKSNIYKFRIFAKCVIWQLTIKVSRFARNVPLLRQTRTHCCRQKCFAVCPRAQHLLRTQILCSGHKKCFWFCSETFGVRNKCFPVCAAQEISWVTMCPQQCVLVSRAFRVGAVFV